MKKIILFAAILFAGVSVVKADEPAALSNSDNTTLNVKLNPIQTLFINPSQKIVDLEYKNVTDYKNGVSLDQKDHLTVYSTGAFAIKVNSSENDIKRANGTETIKSSTLSVQASPGTNNPLQGIFQTATGVKLSTTATTLFSNGTGGVDLAFNVKYSGIGGDTYVNSYFNDENPTVYSTTVTYTIVAQ